MDPSCSAVAWVHQVARAISEGLLEPEDARTLLDGLETATVRIKRDFPQLLATRAALTELAP